MRRAVIACSVIGLSLGFPASADGGLDGACQALERNPATGCRLERGLDAWTLTTSVMVGGGRKASVESVEQRFCRRAAERGAEARVTRWNRIAGAIGDGAKLEWRCGTPRVSAGPRPASGP